MAAANPLMDVVKVLMVESLPHTEEIKGPSIIPFAHILNLITYLTKNIQSVDRFILIIPGYAVKQLLDNVVYRFQQTRQICVYYDSYDDLIRDEGDIKNEDQKLHFCHTQNLKEWIQNLNVDNDPTPSGSNDDVALLWAQRILAKRSNTDAHHSSEPKRNCTNQNNSDQENNVTTMDVYTRKIDPVCTTATRVEILSDIVSTSNSIHIPNNCSTIVNLYQMLVNHFQEVIRVMSNRVNIVENDQQRIAAEYQHIQSALQILYQKFFAIKASQEVILNRAIELNSIQDFLTQEIESLAKALHDTLSTSYDADARSERNKSIYSPPFYSSGSGYKICLRLYLNGDGDTRDKYMSLFMVLMKNDYDAILQWPFPYPVTLCLLNQLEPNDNRMNIIHSVRPDIRSNYLKRPIRSDMNEAYGIKEFLSLEQFEQNQSLFVKDDTMFIGAKIDFLNQNSSIASTVGSPNDEEHVGGINQDLILFS